jgi:hypothetical protein
MKVENVASHKANTQSEITPQVLNPWFDSNGEVKSNSKLIGMSRDWDQATWDAFLDQTVDCGMREQQIADKAFELINESQTESIFGPSDCVELDRDLVARIHEIKRNKLTLPQKRTIDAIFWVGLSERVIAKAMRVSRSTVLTLKARSLKKFKRFLPNPSADCPRVKKPQSTTAQKEKSKD